MKGGRKNMKRAAADKSVHLEDGHCIMQVVSLRGSNQIEVMDEEGSTSIALFPAKFHNSMWIRRGSFVVVDESGKDKAVEFGCKVTCIVSQVLFYKQIQDLQKSPEWPEIFRTAVPNDVNAVVEADAEEGNKDDSSDGEDGLPPLEANTNGIRPYDLHAESESGEDSDTE